MIATLLASNMTVASIDSTGRVLSEEENESEFYWLDGSVKSKISRPAINPDFAPDESCLFDTFQLKCIPGSEQLCPRPQFGNGEPHTCWAKTFINGEWVRHCPDGYHTTDGDETGQCYPNSNDCSDANVTINGILLNFVLRTGDDSANPYNTCIDPRSLCEIEPDHGICKLIESVDPAETNSDDTMVNDIPPDREGLFCDHPSNPGGCYDRNDNPESFCANYGAQYSKFCELIEPICDDSEGVNNIDSTDPECTDEDLPCPENFVRNGEYCTQYKVDCDENPTNVYCTGQRRTDGLQRCDEPDHPGYKFCTELN